MNKQRWQQIEAAYHAALEAEDADRYLAQIGRDDADLATHVRQLLDADAEGEHSACEAIRQYVDQIKPDRPATLGDYRLLEEIGRGGMGTVFRAERIGGEFEQTVAIKIARHAFDAKTRERFLRERQILADLNHKYIARLLDGGTTPDGAPYLVMEHVQGRPITEYCASENLGPRARLELFIGVAEAVAYAHQRLVVHRDLKPSNILVDATGQPKLLDFGIAKLLEDEGGLADSTRTELRVLTPNYAAPEQLTGEPVSTQTDCYALGVVLYELLTGQRPYEVSGVSLRQLERQLLDANVTRPSSVAASSEGPARVRALKGDLDNIVMRCMAREPQRRYSSIQALMDDLRAFLENRPVAAMPDSWAYRLGKFARRNRIVVLASSVLVLATVAFVLVLARVNVQLIEQRNAAVAAGQQAEQAAAEAEAQSRTARAITNFLVSVLVSSAPSFGGDRDISVKAALDRSVDKLDALGDQPAIQAQVAFTVGEVYLSLGQLPEARALFQRAIDALDTEPSANRALLGEVLDRSGDVFRRLEQFQPAREHLERAMHILETDPQANSAWLADTYNNLAVLNLHEGREDQAGELLLKALAINEQREGEHGIGLAAPLQNLATVRWQMGQHEEALALIDRTLAIRERHLGAVHPNVAATLTRQAGYRFEAGRLEEAEQSIARAHSILEQTVDPSHPHFGDSHTWLGRMARQQDQLDTARRHFNQAIDIFTTAVGEQSWRAQQVRVDLGCTDLAAGRVQDAEQSTRLVYEQLKGGSHPQTGARLDKVAGLLIQVLKARGEYQELESLTLKHPQAGNPCISSSAAPARPDGT